MKDELRYAAEWSTYALEQRRAWTAEAPDYVLLVIDGDLGELPAARPAWQRMFVPEGPSMARLDRAFEAIAEDPRVRGVVLQLRDLSLPAASLESLRARVERLREAGKQTVAWATRYHTGSLYVAAACDEVLLQKGGGVAPLGQMRSYPFLADSLDQIGLRFQAVAISPFKSAADSLSRRDMSAESRAQAEWLAEGAYRELVRALAQGRGRKEEEAEAWVDAAPYTDLEALDVGLVDGIVSFEALPARLGREDSPASLRRWVAARKAVVPRPPARPGRHVALLRIEGMIVDGESHQPPMRPPIGLPLAGEARAGDLTVAQEARQVLEDDDVAALVVWIDSPGGSATASEAMASALDEVAERKPVIAAMGPVAGSGGYYVSTPARYVFARPGTLTGSIGVVSGKLVVAGLLDRLRINREVVSRGGGVRLYDGDRPFGPEEIEIVRRGIERTYDVFLARVAEARSMDLDAVHAVAGGRVWTGRQALEHGLVDRMGGLPEALAMARELAGIGPRAAGREIHLRRERLGGMQALAPAAGLDLGLGYALETLRLLGRSSSLCLCPVLVGGRPRLG